MTSEEIMELEILELIQNKGAILENELNHAFVPKWSPQRVVYALGNISKAFISKDEHRAFDDNDNFVRTTSMTAIRIEHLKNIKQSEEKEASNRAAAEKLAAQNKDRNDEVDRQLKELQRDATLRSNKNILFTQIVSIITLLMALVAFAKTLVDKNDTIKIKELQPLIDTLNNNLNSTTYQLKVISEKTRVDTIYKMDSTKPKAAAHRRGKPKEKAIHIIIDEIKPTK